VTAVSDQAGVHEKGTFTLQDAIKNVKNKKDFQEAGAIATFTGVVRGRNMKGEIVQRLTLEAYEEKANEILVKICNDLKKRKGIVDVQIHHLLGEFHVDEDLVYVLVAGSHRENVFPVLQEAVERYKQEAPIFKKEHVITKDGKKTTYWVSDTRVTKSGR
jgi:molybdopterin synthase catalytic subunit